MIVESRKIKLQSASVQGRQVGFPLLTICLMADVISRPRGLGEALRVSSFYHRFRSTCKGFENSMKGRLSPHLFSPEKQKRIEREPVRKWGFLPDKIALMIIKKNGKVTLMRKPAYLLWNDGHPSITQIVLYICVCLSFIEYSSPNGKVSNLPVWTKTN
ncbi:hypothetical protein CDAR_14671 [Caerostris darwini]|uniref:Uncharacterized protein n=1 Tax=Caerostris darwini TaxID=1538125 RepID=A0AAV4T942_9ARAC|nr:hypothetical protein CDAR_14671 [Caerostris darwini]